MRITVEKITDVELMREACSFTIDAPSRAGLRTMYRCEHSPIRTQMFVVRMYDIPTFVSVHLVRHKIGVEHFVKSNRDDRPGYSGEIGREHPVNHMMLINAAALIQMARKRLCGQASTKTQEVVGAIRSGVGAVDPDLALHMVPECRYRNGYCPEIKSCGRFAGGGA